MRRKLWISLLVAVAAATPSSADWNLFTRLEPVVEKVQSNFGNAVAVDGDVVAVAGAQPFASLPPTGAVYVFRKRAPLWWTQEAVLVPESPRGWEEFGFSVAVSGDTLVIGAPGDPQSAESAGAVWVFRRVGDAWTPEAKLLSPRPAANQRFGQAVDIDGDRLVTRSYGDAQTIYVYRRDSTSWALETTLTGDDSGRGYPDWSSSGLDIRGNDVVFGSGLDGVPATSHGVVYQFTFDGVDWNRVAKIPLPEDAYSAWFGASVRLADDVLLVGAPSYGGRFHTGAGAFFVFRKTEGDWHVEARVDCPQPQSGAGFATTLAVEGSIVAASAPSLRRGADTGGVFLFRSTSGSPAFEALLAPAETSTNQFGRSMAYSNGVAFGGPLPQRSSTGSAAIAIFETGPSDANRPPQAAFSLEAYPECSTWSGARLMLDGSSSSDVDSSPGTNDDIARFRWRLDADAASPSELGEGEVRTSSVPLGAHTVRLEVTDRSGYSAERTRSTLVLDRLAPRGGIVSPRDDECIGSSALPLDVRNDFRDDCDSDLTLWRDLPQVGRIGEGDAPPASGFGLGFSVDGNVAAVATQREAGSSLAGAIYVYRRSDAQWVLEARIAAPAGAGSFGLPVLVRGDLLLAGARAETVTSFREGALYVYRHGSGGWSPEQRLVADRPRSTGYFGSSFSVDGDRLAVGAWGGSSTVHIFERTDDGWMERAELQPPDAPPYGWNFGTAVLLDGDRLFVGTPQRRGLGLPNGAVYVFRFDGSRWNLVQTLVVEDRPTDTFGNSIRKVGDSLIVWNDPYPSFGEASGVAAYEFREVDGVWTRYGEFRFRKFRGPAGGIAPLGDRFVLGAPDAYITQQKSGAAYVFERHGDVWEDVRMFHPPTPSYGAGFGSGVATAGSEIFVTAPRNGGGPIDVFDGSPASTGDLPHGLDRIGLTAGDDTGHLAFDSVLVRVDRVPPTVTLSDNFARALVSASPVALGSLFRADDEDGVEGDVVDERLVVNGCVVLDGATYGDGDGRLEDEVVAAGARLLCAAASRCGWSELRSPTFAVEAEDCGGNRGTASRTLSGVTVDLDRACR